MSLFGGARYIRVSGAGEESLEAVAALLAAERAGNPADRPGARVCVLPPNSPSSYSIRRSPMPVPSTSRARSEAEKIAQGLAHDLGLQPEPGVARHLADACAGDRAVIARELEKIALFLDAAPERPRSLDQAALEAIGADLGETAQSALVAAIVDGEPAALGAGARPLRCADGASPVPWLRALTRRSAGPGRHARCDRRQASHPRR